VATRGNDRQTREQRERARAYQARLELHERQGRRRTRDNVIALVVGLLVVLGAIGAQTAYFVAGPGTPEPVPTSTSTPSTPATEAPATPVPDATESAAP
jgi:peptidyl-prolyl cis-trans isomerase B (cyclophilin B)